VVGSDATAAARFAAEELQRYLEAIVGSPIELADRLGTAPLSIVVGPGRLARSLGIDVGDLPRDAFLIRHLRRRGRDIIIVGGRDDQRWKPTTAGRKGTGLAAYERSTLFAVYEFLERFAGVRFYFGFPSGTVVPRASTLRVPIMDVYEAPDFVMRRVSITKGRLPLESLQTQSERVRVIHHELNTLRYETFSIPTTHGLGRTGLLERFGDEHPEYFALRANGERDLQNGVDRPQLCLMNSGLRREVLRDVVAYLDGDPATERGILRPNKRGGYDAGAFAPGYASVMPMDGLAPKNFCRDELCKRWRSAEGDYSDYVWDFVNFLARRLKAYGIRGHLTNIAYAGYRRVPEAPIEDNVVVQLALVGPWKERDPAQREDDALIAQWDAKLGGRGDLLLWNYMNSRAERAPDGTPALSPRNIAAWYQRNARHLAGAYLQSDTHYRLFNYLNYYVFHRIAWDTETDVEALLRDHHEKMFGAAAEPMAGFFDRLEALWTERGIVQYRAKTRPGIITPLLSETWGDIYDEEELARLRAFFDDAERRTAASPEPLSRVRYLRRNFLGEIERGRRAYYTRQRRLEDLVFDVMPMRGDDVVIDGRLDEAFWEGAEEVHLMASENGEDPEVATRVAAAWTRTHLLLGFEAREPSPRRARLRAGENRLGLVLGDPADPVAGDRWQIWVDSAGQLIERRGDAGGGSVAWQSGSRAAVSERAGIWSAEIQIPLSALPQRESSDLGESLVANFARLRALGGKRPVEQWSSWSPFVRRTPNEPERFGTLRLLREPAPPSSSIRNGGLEEAGAARRALAGWSFGKGAALDRSTFREGRQSIRLEAREFSDVVVRQAMNDLLPDTRYALTFFVRTEALEGQDGADYAGGFVNLMADTNRFYPYMRFLGDLPWTKQVYEFTTAPERRARGRSYIALGFREARGRIWFDDIRLRRIEDDTEAAFSAPKR
jgi:hypothetical protein